MTKKVLSIILALTMVLGMIPFAGLSAFAAAQKIGTSDVTWELTDSNKTLIIGGTGAMPDFVPGTDTRAPWLASAQTAVTTVIIGSGVTTIGNMAFYNMEKISSITIPSSVKSIGVEAFTGCTSLKNLYIESIESWCNVTFRKNGSTENSYPFTAIRTGVGSLYVNGEEIKELKIPNTVTSIPKRAFYRCSITSVTIPSSVKTINREAFYLCSKLTSVIVKSTEPPTLQEYSAMPYSNSGFKIYVPAGKNDDYQNTSPWSFSYLKNKLTEAYMAEAAPAEHGTVILDKDCFPTADYTTASETVTVTATPDEGYQLKSLVYNDGTKDYDITASKSFTMPTANVTVKAVFEEAPAHTHEAGEEYIYNADAHWFACKADGCDLKTAADYEAAFDKDATLKTAFGYAAHVDENEDFVCDVCGYENRAGAEEAGFYYFDDSDDTILSWYAGEDGEIVIPGWTTKIEHGAFQGNGDIEKVTIPASVETIGEGAFNNTGITSIFIPASVKTIGKAAFDGCSNLESVTFEEGSMLKFIGGSAFNEGIDIINFEACKEIETIGEMAFYECTGLDDINFEVFQKLETIDPAAFYGIEFTSIYIPASVTTIGQYAFETTEPLTDLYLNWTTAETILPGDNIFVLNDINTEPSTKVHIPAGTLKLYQENDFWKDYFLAEPHIHSFTYDIDEQNANVIIATCANEDKNCDLPNSKLTLTLTANGGTYDGENSFPATTDDDTVKFTETTGTTLELTYTKGAAAVTELKNAGDYTAKLTVKEGDAVVATARKDFTVAKAEQTITANNKTVIYGETGATVGAAAEGTLSYAVKSGDSVTVDENGALTIVKLGDTVITVSAAETENYNAATKDVTVTVKNNEKTISVENDSENGSITLSGDGITVNEDTTVAVVGSTVTVTDTPAENYKLKSLVVLYGGEIHDITDTKTFIMPNTDVTVKAEFKLFSARLDELLALFETLDEKDYIADNYWVWEDYKCKKQDAEDAEDPEMLADIISALERLLSALNPIFVVDEYGALQYYNGEATEVEIPATVINLKTNSEIQVISIGREAFRENKIITKVTIPDSVEEIDTDAFSGCSKLKSVVLPNSLESLEDGVFQECKALESIVLPANLSRVDKSFIECTALKSVTVMSEQLVSFNENSFEECGTLTIKVPAKLVDDYIKAYQTDETYWQGYTIEAIPHTHSFSYEAKDNTITATCTDMAGKYCPMEEAITLTLGADGGTYNGNSFAATTDDAAVKFTETTGAAIGDILYSGTGITGTTTTAPKNVGTYTATVTVTYGESQTATLTKEFTIAKANATVTADDKEKTYGDTDPTFTATVTGTVGEDVLTYTFERAEGTDAGTYAITPTGEAVQGNYNVSYVPGTLTINRKAISVPTAVTNLTYNEQEQTGVLDGTGYTLTGNTATDAGNHTATATPTANYKWEDGTTAAKDITWTIAKANYDGTVTASGSINAFKSSTVDITLPALPDGAGYKADPTFTYGTASVSGTTLTLTVGGTDIPGGLENFTVTVPVTGATNYKDYDVTVTVTPVYHAHSFDSENWTADGANGHYRACIGAGDCDVTDFSNHTADGFAYEGHTYTDYVCDKCGYNDVATAKADAKAALTGEKENAASDEAKAALDAAIAEIEKEETSTLEDVKKAKEDGFAAAAAADQALQEAKNAAIAVLTEQFEYDPLEDDTLLIQGKNGIESATNIPAVQAALEAALALLKAAQQAALEKNKQEAIDAIKESLGENPTDEQKATAEKAIAEIEAAETSVTTKSVKESTLERIELIAPCKHSVSGFCKVYNEYIDIPFLNVIFRIVHKIIHVFKNAF